MTISLISFFEKSTLKYFFHYITKVTLDAFGNINEKYFFVIPVQYGWSER